MPGLTPGERKAHDSMVALFLLFLLFFVLFLVPSRWLGGSVCHTCGFMNTFVPATSLWFTRQSHHAWIPQIIMILANLISHFTRESGSEPNGTKCLVRTGIIAGKHRARPLSRTARMGHSIKAAVW